MSIKQIYLCENIYTHICICVKKPKYVKYLFSKENCLWLKYWKINDKIDSFQTKISQQILDFAPCNSWLLNKFLFNCLKYSTLWTSEPDFLVWGLFYDELSTQKFYFAIVNTEIIYKEFSQWYDKVFSPMLNRSVS